MTFRARVKAPAGDNPPGRRFATAIRVLCLTVPLLGACSLFDDEDRLEGERIPVRPEAREPVAPAPQAGGLTFGGVTSATPGAGGGALPPPQRVDAWTQTNGLASHNAGHLAGPVSLQRAWTADAGTGSSAAGEITSAPVGANGRLFTLDAASRVRAFDADSGNRVWETDLTPDGEDGDEGFGGGLATVGGRVFATTGFGEVLALDAAGGEVLWRTRLGAPVRAAPAVADGIVVAVARDNSAFGIDAGTGEVRWRAQGATSGAGLLGGASPAIAGGGAVLPFGSGEIVAVGLQNGRRFWSAAISGGRRGLARSAISDVTGDPVIVGQLAIAANQAGRIVALIGRNGQRAWTRSVGATGPIWAAGDSLFLVTDTALLMRLSAQNGATIWQQQLPAFEDEEDREDPIGYSGPVLVEGRVLFTSSEGELFAFEGVGGSPVGVTDLAGGSVTGPVVLEDTLYVLNDDGTLEAYR
ncbi:MAG: PQQ-binding-like beta-propeller repeat protein [Pseudomonadota bacterium]